MDELLKLLKENARETPENLARMLNQSVEEIQRRIQDYEKRGVIRGYQAVVNRDALDSDLVTAVIEVKVTPEREGGFNHIAKRISKFEVVSSLYLMSGTFDLLLFVSGRDLKEVAWFVAEKLATIPGVLSTATHFMLKTYKADGVYMDVEDDVERLKVTP